MSLAVHPEQLDFALDQLLECEPFAPLADRLGDRRRVYDQLGALQAGSGRLLAALVKLGLDPDALCSAAALIVELDRQAQVRQAVES